MPIQIDGKTPDTIRIGRTDGTLATVGEARVWDGRWKTVYTSWKPRTVTIRTTTNGWNATIDSGDTDLISSLTAGGVRFEEAVVCDKDVRVGVGTTRAGNRIEAGQSAMPTTPMRMGDVYTFTSVR